ncbi:MAG: gliding motility-associated C-terminal domain-containing protein, partial [Bacteroidota bacterium]
TLGSNTDAAACNGNIELEVEGTSGDETYAWSSNVPSGSTSSVTGLCADQYTVAITDVNGCVQIDTFDLTLFAADAITNPAFCPSADSTGNIDLNVQGGVAVFTYNWADANGNLVAQTEDLVNVVAGEYTVTVTEASGTSIVETFNVNATSDFEVDVVNNTEDINGFGVSCNGDTDAELVATGMNSNQYAYEWFNEAGEEVGNNTNTLADVGAGIYVAEVTDDQNCVIRDTLTVVEPNALEAMPDILDVECNGDNNGEILLTVNGGLRFTNNDYQYAWSHDADNTTDTAIDLEGGAYVVTITDANDCILVDTLAVIEPDSLIVLTDITPFSPSTTGGVTTQVSGGTATYRYEWTDARTGDPVSRTAEVTDIAREQTLCLVVTDMNGCSVKIPSLEIFNNTNCLRASPVLTPNGDDINEAFEIQCLSQYPQNTLEVYSRWGQLIFVQDNYNNAWNGRDVDGMPLPNGAYYYVFRFIDQNGDEQQELGSLSILND